MSTPDTDTLMNLADDYATKTAKGSAYLGIDGFEAMMPSQASRETLRTALAAQAEAHAAELAKHQQSAAWCEYHKPKGGTRSVCVICSGMKLSAALSRISYVCGEPNEMECGPYDVHCDEDAVVRQVVALHAEVERLTAELQREGEDHKQANNDAAFFMREVKRLTAERDALKAKLASIEWSEPKPGELPRKAIQCFGCEGFPSGDNDPCDVCGRRAARTGSKT